jgi:hypothetical protein
MINQVDLLSTNPVQNAAPKTTLDGGKTAMRIVSDADIKKLGRELWYIPMRPDSGEVRWVMSRWWNGLPKYPENPFSGSENMELLTKKYEGTISYIVKLDPSLGLALAWVPEATMLLQGTLGKILNTLNTLQKDQKVSILSLKLTEMT